MKADFFTDQPEAKGQKIPRIHFTIRIGSWMVDPRGIWRWSKFTAKKPNAKGRHATWFGWKLIRGSTTL